MVISSKQPFYQSIKANLGVASLCSMLLVLVGCSSTTVKTTSVIPVVQQQQEIEEEMLLDVGVAIFDPNNQEALESVDEETIIFPEVRNAEARYFPQLVADTLQSSAAWGAVRVVPSAKANVDVVLNGKILKSDGEVLTIHVTAVDATGRQWFSKEFTALASRYSYDPKRQTKFDAFQNVYNQVANELLTYKRQLPRQEVLNIRQVSELKFAKSFAPKAFNDHIGTGEDGYLVVKRLPAENDPMMSRIRQIRERDYLFIDTMQDYYNTFAKDMARPYWQWRQQSYHEVMALRNMQRSARDRMIMGTTALVAGILGAANSTSAVTRTAGSVAMAAGGYVIKSGLDKDAESKMHIEALQELGDSLEASIEPSVIELEDRTVTLSGTVESQYKQWRDILKEIYQIDTGETASQ